MFISIEKSTSKLWDVVIIGGGPGGCQSAIHAACDGLKTLIIERSEIGGQIRQTPLLENLMGYEKGISGASFASAMKEQALRVGACFLFSSVAGLRRESDESPITVALETGENISTRYVVIATGSHWTEITTPGVAACLGNCIFYGPQAIMEDDIWGKTVCVIGGGNSAGQAVVELARKAEHVHVVVRSELKTSQYLTDRIMSSVNISLWEHTNMLRAYADAGRCRVLLDSPKGPLDFSFDRVYLCSGNKPSTGWLAGEVALDESGYILTGKTVNAPSELCTSMYGVFAIGDVRSGTAKRLTSAIGDAGFAISEIFRLQREENSAVQRDCLECHE